MRERMKPLDARPLWPEPWRDTSAGEKIVPSRERCELMADVGDRIRLSSMKGPDREGIVTAVTGSLIRVRW